MRFLMEMINREPINNKLRPCDCRSSFEAAKLDHQGIGRNGDEIRLDPNVVIMTVGHTTIRIPQKTFKMFAEWYLEEQEIK